MLLYRTIKHLKLMQMFYQAKYRLIRPAYIDYDSSTIQGVQKVQRLKTEPISKYKCYDGNTFSFLNLQHEFAGWNFTDNGMLWTYNQNYFDWINQEDISIEDCVSWIDKFIEVLPTNKIGLDPYPTALRSINWVKFFCRYPETASKTRLDSLYSQLRLLEKKLEYHLLGNHLLEDAYALYIGGAFFNDENLFKKAQKLLLAQLTEQILPDGAHYEQSPMYHCILLDRLLDCINFHATQELEKFATMMLGHLENITWADGTIPLLNDSANCIAPTPMQLFDYAKRLGIRWQKIPLNECGYRKMRNGAIEAIIDIGNITASYQPAHTHADTFNYEIRIEGLPFVVDTGISTYNKTERRQLERSTISHNCVSVNEKDTSEVWGGFRVGRRCHVNVTKDTSSIIETTHDGFMKSCKRRFSMTDDAFIVEDWYDGEAVSYIHLAEGAEENRINIEKATKVEFKPWLYSIEYNKFRQGKVIEIHFKNYCKYTIH